jgi:hypothetical protein
MTGSVILLDVAARVVPIAAAATVFAVIMALASFGASLGEGIGGYLYDYALGTTSATTAYRATLVAGVTVMAACWLWLPRLLREIAPPSNN